MTDPVRDAYDARAREYTDLNLADLDRVPLDREWLGAFAGLVSPGAGVVADSGAAALLLERDPELSPTAVAELLGGTAPDDDVDACAAIRRLSGGELCP